MKIIQISSYYPPHLGGLENAVKNIAECLAVDGCDVEVITSNIGIGAKKERPHSKNNLKINYLPAFDFAHTAIIPNLFFKLLKYDKKTIFHVHVAQAYVPEIVYFVTKIRKIKYIAHLHTDLTPTGWLGFLLPAYKKVILKPFFQSASKVIVLSEEYKDIVEKKYCLPDNIIIVPNGVGIKFFVRKKIFNNTAHNLLYVGRLSKQKNVDNLLQAMSSLKDKYVLNIVGDGPERENLYELTKKLGLKNVIFHGTLTDKHLVDIYAKADIFLLSSDYEGLSLSIIEAMASGTPVIASKVKGITSFVEGTGILVDPPTSDNFAKEIDRLAHDKKLRIKLSISGREKTKHYLWKNVTKKIEKVYGLKK
jgi:glycosyltransferase involved in cell wall biosynthesis